MEKNKDEEIEDRKIKKWRDGEYTSLIPIQTYYTSRKEILFMQYIRNIICTCTHTL